MLSGPSSPKCLSIRSAADLRRAALTVPSINSSARLLAEEHFNEHDRGTARTSRMAEAVLGTAASDQGYPLIRALPDLLSRMA